MNDENKHLVGKECIADRTDPKAMNRKLEEIKSYLGRPALNIIMNNQRLDLEKFDDTKIINESILTQR